MTVRKKGMTKRKSGVDKEKKGDDMTECISNIWIPDFSGITK